MVNQNQLMQLFDFFHVKAIRERLERVTINWSLPLKKFPNSSGWKRRLLLLLRRF